MSSKLLAGTLVLTFAAALGCRPKESTPRASDEADTARADTAPARVGSAEGFQTPEAVRYDPESDQFFVSNINGNPSQKDNNGFISRLRSDGSIDSLRFIAGGAGGTTLHAPKGLAIVGDTLWVADIDAVRGFDKRTGAPIATVEFGKQALFLNDITVGPATELYVTDTAILFDQKGEVSHPAPDRVFRISRDRKVSVVLESDTLARPNGITWNAARSEFIVVPFGSTSLFRWKPGETTPVAFATGPGMQDGVEVLDDGRVLVSSWADSSVFAVANGAVTKLITGVPSPADIGVDTQRGRVAIPVFQANRVELWQLADR